MIVLDRGRICEEGPVDQVFHAPTSARARELLEAAPRLTAAPEAPVPPGRVRGLSPCQWLVPPCPALL